MTTGQVIIFVILSIAALLQLAAFMPLDTGSKAYKTPLYLLFFFVQVLAIFIVILATQALNETKENHPCPTLEKAEDVYRIKTNN